MISESSVFRRIAAWTLAVCTAAVALPAAAQEPAGFEPIEAIRAAAEDYVRGQLARERDTVHVRATALDSRLRLSACAQALRAALPSGMAMNARPTVGVSCESPAHWTIYVPVTVERRISVLVLKHSTGRDAYLGRDDVNVETRSVTGLDAAFLGDPSELAGRAVRRTLPAGTVLTVDMLEPNFRVRRGQEVVLLARSEGFEVRASGRALEDAAAGARVKVQNLSSMKVIEGVAEQSGTVRIGP